MNPVLSHEENLTEVSKDELIRDLQEQVAFYKTFSDQDGLAYQLHVKFKNGQRVWVNSQKVSVQELQMLDRDPEIDAWISEKQGSRYSDKY